MHIDPDLTFWLPQSFEEYNLGLSKYEMNGLEMCCES